MKRYQRRDNKLSEHPDGKWVRHADAEAEIARLNAELRRQRKDSCPIWFCHELTGPKQYAEDMEAYDRQTDRLCGEPESPRTREEYIAEWHEANEAREREIDEQAAEAEGGDDGAVEEFGVGCPRGRGR